MMMTTMMTTMMKALVAAAVDDDICGCYMSLLLVSVLLWLPLMLILLTLLRWAFCSCCFCGGGSIGWLTQKRRDATKAEENKSETTKKRHRSRTKTAETVRKASAAEILQVELFFIHHFDSNTWSPKKIKGPNMYFQNGSKHL